MRMLMEVNLPFEPFNTYVRDGSAGARIGQVLAEVKPEAVYFTERDGRRGAVLVVDVPEAAAIPALSEPFFLTFGAEVRFRIAMTPEDLQRAGLEKFAT